jgi:hypothetical protein
MYSWQTVLFCALGLIGACAAGPNPCLECDREMRKTIESLQAWRRLHQGHYPGRIVEVKEAGLLPGNGALCPDWRRERLGANAAHTEATSRTELGDPPGTYEYELSDRVLTSEIQSDFFPSNAPSYTRQDLKAELLRRPFYEQIPLLRCSSHRTEAPPPFAGHEDVRRNITEQGNVYWSRKFWEQLWLGDVPYCARSANVLFGLKGPPFHTDRAPTLPGALDLRPWACASGDSAWWWDVPLFSDHQIAANLRALFQQQHGRIIEIADTQWWQDGLVQLQGRFRDNNADYFNEPGMLAFVWQRTGLQVEEVFREASWLQGTVWRAPVGDTAGWLVWHYADSTAEQVPITYGKTTGRFWADLDQLNREKDFPEPVWKQRETAEAVGKERVVRLFQQTWTNPRPDVLVTSLDFVSNTNSPAAPFLIAVNIKP